MVVPHSYVSQLDYAWKCEDIDEIYQQSCRADTAVLRVSFCSTIFFLFMAVAAAGAPQSNNNGWCTKFMVYIVLVVASMFTPSYVFDQHGFLNIARVGGAIFTVIQQIILIDLAYNFNDKFVANADEDDKNEPGSGDSWLKALLAISAFIMIGAYTALGFLFHYFGGCSTNDAFLWLTLILTLFATGVQLTGDEGSLLTSAVMTGYATYLCYSAVSNNPVASCNPMLGNDSVLSVVLGLAIILASMAWTITSYASSMTEMFTSNSGAESLIEEGGQKPEEAVTGVVTGGDPAKYGATSTNSNAGVSTTGGEAFSSVRDSVGGDFDGGQSWKLNLVLALMSTWFPMVLTSWGAVNENGSAANTTVGEVSMWMIIAAQWTALILYSWTLLAPRLFPDRDFGQ